MFFKSWRKKKQPKLYLKCNTLPIHNFNECAENDDLNYLKINHDDIVSQEILESVWLDISDEFIKLSKNVSAINTIKRKTGLVLLEKRLQVYEAVRINIAVGNDVTDVCRRYRLKADKITQHIGITKNEIATMKSQLPKIDPNAPKQKGEFDRSIVTLMKNGFQVDRFKMVVSEWCLALQILE